MWICIVALRKESVDRNGSGNAGKVRAQKSLSARRAWIEIVIKNNKEYRRVVALRKESVDRNIIIFGVMRHF